MSGTDTTVMGTRGTRQTEDPSDGRTQAVVILRHVRGMRGRRAVLGTVAEWRQSTEICVTCIWGTDEREGRSETRLCTSLWDAPNTLPRVTSHLSSSSGSETTLQCRNWSCLIQIHISQECRDDKSREKHHSLTKSHPRVRRRSLEVGGSELQTGGYAGIFRV